MRTKSIRRRNAMLKRIVLLISSLILLCFITISFMYFKSAAHENRFSDNKLYRSVQIEKGDSLWSIANRYMTEDYANIDQYMDELRNLNNLESDTLIEGNYLSVVCASENP